MSPPQLRKFKQRLLDLQQAIGQRAEDLVAAIHDQESPPGEHECRTPPAGTAEPDWAVEQVEEDVGQQILAALARIGDGSYGACLDCGKKIPMVRLEAVPYAARCVTCERVQDDRRK